MLPLSFDLFCRVIDNYGDIGVCWRLAKQLVQPPFSAQVRLWVDDLPRFCALAPGIDPALAQQQHAQVQVVRWEASSVTNSSYPEPHTVVLEAFACAPPAGFVRCMRPDTLWINLEYLSAQDWVAGCHGLPSPQANGLKKWFFFPGFTSHTGGLLREIGLHQRRNTWQTDPQARWRLLHQLGLPETALHALQHGALQVLLFCYPHAPTATLLHALQARGKPVVVLACPGSIDTTCQFLARKGLVQLCPIPFVAQETFDLLLWGSDLNCVRGEDSLVRALWAARPLLWHIYPQADAAHLDKLDAWLARAPYPAPVHALIRAWNTPPHTAFAQHLQHCLTPATFSHWRTAAQQWDDTLSQHQDLASALVAFCTEKQKTR